MSTSTVELNKARERVLALARQIEDRIVQEKMHTQAAVVQIKPQQGIVVVECDDEFGSRLNDLPGASYAEKAKPAAKAPRVR